MRHSKWLRGPLPLLWLFLLAALLRFGHMAFIAESPLFLAPTSDEFEHHQLALTLSSGDWLGRSVGMYHRPQLFAYVIAFLQFFLGQHYLITHIFLGLVDSIAVCLWYLIARRAFPRPAALLGAVGIACYWPFVYFAGTGYMESFAMFVMACFLLSCVRHLEQTWRNRAKFRGLGLLCCGVLGGLCVMSRPTSLLVLPFVAAILFDQHRRAERSPAHGLGAALLFVAGVLLALAPNTARHWFMFGSFAPLGTGSELNFHMGNEVDGWGWAVSSPGIEFRAYQSLPFVLEELNPEDRESVRRFWKERGGSAITTDPAGFLGFMGMKSLWMLNATEIHCTQNFQEVRSLSPVLRVLPGYRLLGALGMAGVALLAFGFFLRRNIVSHHSEARVALTKLAGGSPSRRAARTLLVTWYVVYLAGVVLYLAIARHRLPALPPLILFGGWITWILWRGAPGLRNVALALLAVALLVCSLPVVPAWYREHERWWTRVNLGVALGALGRHDEAAAEFTKATELMPEKLEGWLQLSAAEEGRGDFVASASASKRLLELQRERFPDHYMIEAEILERLARVQLLAGDVPGAEATAREFVALIGYAPQPLLLLSEGRGEEARAWLEGTGAGK